MDVDNQFHRALGVRDQVFHKDDNVPAARAHGKGVPRCRARDRVDAEPGRARGERKPVVRGGGQAVLQGVPCAVRRDFERRRRRPPDVHRGQNAEDGRLGHVVEVHDGRVDALRFRVVVEAPAPAALFQDHGDRRVLFAFGVGVGVAAVEDDGNVLGVHVDDRGCDPGAAAVAKREAPGGDKAVADSNVEGRRGPVDRQVDDNCHDNSVLVAGCRAPGGEQLAEVGVKVVVLDGHGDGRRGQVGKILVGARLPAGEGRRVRGWAGNVVLDGRGGHFFGDVPVGGGELDKVRDDLQCKRV